MNTKPITNRQKQVLDFIVKFIRENGYAPSVRDIMKNFDFKSPRGAHKHLITLEEKGYIERKGVSRGVTLTSKSGEIMINQKLIPVVGNIAAGEAIEAIENATNNIPLPTDFLNKDKEFYALKVEGNSMIDAHICPNDIVIIQKQNEANDGDVIVALINENYATLKTLKRINNKEIHLIPSNKDMEIIKVSPKKLKIQGKLVSIMRFI